MNEILTLAEAAEYLRVSERTLFTLLKSNAIPHARVGKQYRFLRSQLAQYVSEQTVTNSGADTRVSQTGQLRRELQKIARDMGLTGDPLASVSNVARPDQQILVDAILNELPQEIRNPAPWLAEDMARRIVLSDAGGQQ